MRTVAAIAASTLATVCLLAFREKPLIPPVETQPDKPEDDIDRTDAMVETPAIGGLATPEGAVGAAAGPAH